MVDLGKLLLLAAAVTPTANATVAADGTTLRPRVATAAVPSRKKRRQIVGTIFSEAVPGFDPTSAPWTTIRAPRNQHRTAKHRRGSSFDVEIESSLHPGTFCKVHVEYGCKKTKAVRTASINLVETNRAVRADDGGLGWMVGAGHHLSYAGLIEYFKPKGAPSPAALHRSHSVVPPPLSD
jgi:hypothetical protein